MAIKVDDYKKFWSKVVLPDFTDFQSEPDNIRRAFHLANSLFHMADWLYWPNKAYIDATFTYRDKNGAAQRVQDEKTFANAVRDFHPDFELIRGIANSAKHLQLNNRGRHPASPSHAANTVVQATGYGEGGFGSGPYSGTERVMLEGPNNQDLEFSDLAESVKTMWETLCRIHNFPLV